MDKDILLNNYFEGNLSEEEKQQFNELLSNDSEFKAEFEFQKKAKIAVALSERKKMKNQLKEIENSRKQKSNNKTWLSIAASIVVILSLGFIFFWNSSAKNDNLYGLNIDKMNCSVWLKGLDRLNEFTMLKPPYSAKILYRNTGLGKYPKFVDIKIN